MELVDWKRPENRGELFTRYLRWRMTVHDLDHTHYCKILTEGYDYERKAWFALLFGMTYRTPQAFAYSETFPYFHQIDWTEAEEWHKLNWKRTSYGTDARYNKGHFIAQSESIRKWLNGKTFEEKIDSLMVGDPVSDFWSLFNSIKDNLYKYGRMTAWLTCQALHDVLDLNIRPEHIMIADPGKDSSMGSIWNGACARFNKDEWMLGKYGTFTPTKTEIDYIKGKIDEEHARIKEEFGIDVDFFKWESIWCQYKRFFNGVESKEYPGHSSGDAASRYLYFRENWPEIDWSKFRKALLSQPGIIKGMTYQKWMNGTFGKTGLLMNMHELFEDMPNSYELLKLDPNDYLIKELWLDEGLPVPVLDLKKNYLKTELGLK